MKQRSSNPFRPHLFTLAALVAVPSAHAAPITWGAATTMSADADVVTTGAHDRAYIFNGASTINGVSFTTFSGSGDTDGFTSGATHNGYNPNGGNVSPNYNNLSAAYKIIANNGRYSDNGTGSITLNNLNTNLDYTLQVWVNDSRTFGVGRTETIAGSPSLTYNVQSNSGGIGQFVTGTFTASAATQALPISASASAQINALNLRATGVTAGNTATITAPRNWSALTLGAASVLKYDISTNSQQLTAISGDGTLEKTGAGTLTLSGASTYTGSTTLNGGGLTLATTGSIAAASDIQVNSGTLAITDSGGGRTLTNDVVLNGGVVMVQGAPDNTGTGGTITFSMGNVIHTFTAPGSLFLPLSVASSNQLIVGAGGGGGGGTNNVVYAAGGGGGRVLNLTSQALAAGTTAVVVGAGGTGGGNAANGTAGGASSIGANTAAGGGGGGVLGGGVGGTSGSGNLGGVVHGGYRAGGGGGDSAAGSNGTSVGGAGTLGTITGSFYGGGGGGGSDSGSVAGGVGGGGNGSAGGSNTAGTANTGGGGGAGGTGAAGGSGIAIIQYAYVAAAAGAVTLSGAIDLQSASTLDAFESGGLLDVTGSISTSMGSGGLTIASSNSAGGVVRFGSANTYVGNTSVNSGATLRMNATNALPSGSGKGNLSLSGNLDLNGQATTSLNGLSGAGTIDNNAGAGTYALSVGNNDQTSTFGGVIQNTTGTLGLTKTGTGTLTLSNTSTYTGATNVSAGTLVVNGNISTSITTVNSGGTLGGSGTVGALTVLNGGTHAPGTSPSIQNTGNYSNAGTLGIEIDGSAVGTGYDQVNVTGTVSLSGLLSITMGYTPAVNELFFILANNDSDPIAGTLFSNAPIDGNTYTLGGQQFQISYFGNQTSPGVGTFTGGNDVVLMAIPEPNVAVLLGSLGILALVRRRRN